MSPLPAFVATAIETILEAVDKYKDLRRIEAQGFQATAHAIAARIAARAEKREGTP